RQRRFYRADRFLVVDFAPPVRQAVQPERPADGPAAEAERADLQFRLSQLFHLHEQNSPFQFEIIAIIIKIIGIMKSRFLSFSKGQFWRQGMFGIYLDPASGM